VASQQSHIELVTEVNGALVPYELSSEVEPVLPVGAGEGSATCAIKLLEYDDASVPQVVCRNEAGESRANDYHVYIRSL
jgi:hypothetical protein